MSAPHIFGKVCKKHPGLRGERYPSNYGCLKCTSEHSKINKKKWRRDPVKREREHARVRRWKQSRNPRTKILILVHAARYRALRKGIEHSITIEDVSPFPTHCPVLGIPINYGPAQKSGRRDPDGPSIDRVDNTKGYVKGNVEVISWRANAIKSDGTADEHLRIAEYMRSGR